jgi:tRNA wybutosine-synthesizing protein 3
LNDAQLVLSAALTAGFRESGAVGLNASKDGTTSPMVAVRSTGLGMESIVGYEDNSGNLVSLVDEDYLHKLMSIANHRFKMNTERIERFWTALLNSQSATTVNPAWEDSEERKRRKREQGLKMQEALKAKRTAADNQDDRMGDLSGLDGVLGD